MTNTDAYTYIHKLIVVIYRHSLTWPQRKHAFCLTNKKCMELFYFTINKLSRTNHRKIMILICPSHQALLECNVNTSQHVLDSLSKTPRVDSFTVQISDSLCGCHTCTSSEKEVQAVLWSHLKWTCGVKKNGSWQQVKFSVGDQNGQR